MSREQVVTLYSSVMPLENAERFVEQLFSTFDQDNNGHFDFHVYTFHPCIRHLTQYLGILEANRVCRAGINKGEAGLDF